MINHSLYKSECRTKKMRHRYYKISIHLGPIRYVANSKIHDIEEGKSTILPGLIYSIPSILLGWWGFKLFRSIKETTETLAINFSGGEDITKSFFETKYDEDVNYVWDNLLRVSTQKINKDELEAILSLQIEFIEKNPKDEFHEVNIEYLLSTISKLNISNVDRELLSDVFETLQMYESIPTHSKTPGKREFG